MIALVVALLATAGALPLPGTNLSGPYQGQRPPATSSLVTLRLIDPTPDDYLTGPSVLQAVFEPPDTKFERVTFIVDGRPQCTVTERPIACRWNAGAPPVVSHRIQAVAVLPGGRKVPSAIVRTKELDTYHFREDVPLVQITVSVLDSDNKFVSGFLRESFRVYEDDRPISGFQFRSVASDDVPLEIIPAVDHSGSMTDSLSRVKLAFKEFLSALRPQDTVLVKSFNDMVYTVSPTTDKIDARLRKVDRLAAFGGTSLYEAVVRCLGEFRSIDGRRALVIFTDGEDTTSPFGREAAESKAETSDVTMYMIGQGKALAASGLRQVLEGLAKKSGGRAFFTDRPDELHQVFRQIIDELSNQYLIWYQPSHPSTDTAWHKLRVELHDMRGHTVRHKQGYRMNAVKK